MKWGFKIFLSFVKFSEKLKKKLASLRDTYMYMYIEHIHMKTIEIFFLPLHCIFFSFVHEYRHQNCSQITLIKVLLTLMSWKS